MEGSESGALAPTDASTEVETWAKFSNFPAEFLTSDALGMIASSIGSPVMTDEDTYEKLENHKWPPKLRRKLHSSITFVRALVRVSVTEPLPPSVAVFCPQGRKFIIRIDYDPTPKICRNCLCAGHFDFECCGIVKETVECMVDDAVAVEDVLGADFQLADCCDSMIDEVDGEQGAVTIDGVESFEDSSVVEAVIFPAATCDFDVAHVGELEADLTMVDELLEQSLVERTAAVLEVQPLPPATSAADGSEGTVFCDGFVCYEDPPVVEAVLEVSPLSLPPATCEFGAAKAEAVQSFSDRVNVEPLVGEGIVADLLDSAGDSIAADLQELAAEPISVGLHEEPSLERNAAVLEVQPLLPAIIAADGSEGTVFSDGFFGFEDPPVVEAVLDESPPSLPPASCVFGAAIAGDLEAVQEPSLERNAAVSCLIDEQVAGFNVLSPFEPRPFFMLQFSVVNGPRNHHKWRDKSVVLGLLCDTLDEQGLFSFEKLDVLQMLPRLVWNLAATYHEQLFGVFHKWRDFTDEQGLFEDDSGSGFGLLGLEMQDVDCLSGIRDFIDGVLGTVTIDRAECHVSPPVVETDLAEIFHYFEQVFSVVNSPKKHHKWCDKSDVQGLFCCSYGMGLFGLDEDPSGDCKFLSRLVWNSAATNHDLLFFKIHHKWRDKGLLICCGGF